MLLPERVVIFCVRCVSETNEAHLVEGGAWLAVDTAQAHHLGEAFEEPRTEVGFPRAVGVASEDARAEQASAVQLWPTSST